MKLIVQFVFYVCVGTTHPLRPRCANNNIPLRGELFCLSTCFSKETKFVNSVRRHQPTLWKIPLFISSNASLAQLK